MLVIGDYWPTGQERGDSGCFEWDDARIREEGRRGTGRELQAYLDAGYILKPESVPIDIVASLFQECDKTPVTMRDVIRAVAAKHGFTPMEVIGNTRSKEVVAARREIICLIHENLGKSMPEIGRALGGRDHTTILHHLKRSGNYKARKLEALCG